MSDVDIVQEAPAEEPVIRPEAPPIESRFLFVDVASMRAKQLRKGAKVRLYDHERHAIKPERLAMDEVRHHLVEWTLPEFSALVESR